MIESDPDLEGLMPLAKFTTNILWSSFPDTEQGLLLLGAQLQKSTGCWEEGGPGAPTEPDRGCGRSGVLCEEALVIGV